MRSITLRLSDLHGLDIAELDFEQSSLRELLMYRKGLITLLLNKPMGLAEIARLLDLPLRDVEDDLQHLQKSLHHSAEYRLVVHPAHCRKCGFRFHADKLHKPGKCPQCHETWIEEPRLEVVRNA